MNKLKYLLLAALVTATGCEVVKVVEPTTTEPSPSPAQKLAYNLLDASSSTITIRASWTKPTSDGKGDPEYYLHTMTANKTVTGTLPVRKRVNGTADTVTIGRPVFSDTLILVSKVWSVRRGLESTSPATGQLVIRTADGPPPPPDTVVVDTIVLSSMTAGETVQMSELFTMIPVDTINTRNYRSLFIREEDGTTVFTHDSTTYITLVKH